MRKSTLYLPHTLKRSLERRAAESGRSEADLIRAAVAAQVRGAERPRPRGRLFERGEATLAQRADEALAGFGDR